MSPKVGFIGLGTMGGPMARRLTSAGLSERNKCLAAYSPSILPPRKTASAATV
jgi:3-hydroxyisobutyrate dehydrogenase-like beta-hydroxyacid dehydrogenase